MSTSIIYTNARENFAKLCSQVAATREPVLIRRRGAEDVASVSAEELAGIMNGSPATSPPRTYRGF